MSNIKCITKEREAFIRKFIILYKNKKRKVINMKYLINFLKTLFTKKVTRDDATLTTQLSTENNSIENSKNFQPAFPLQNNLGLETYNDESEYKGIWKVCDLSFVQIWNNDSYEPQKRNYSRRMLIFRTPNYRSSGDENYGTDNGDKESISLTVNVEEGKVFLDNYSQAKKIFKSKKEAELFVENAQHMFDTQLDIGIGTHFIYGMGGKMATLMEHDNPNIKYIPIVFPDNEKFKNPMYRETVEWDLIRKGAIKIIPSNGIPYLAFIERKEKPRKNVEYFSRYF